MRPFEPSNHIVPTRISGIPCEVKVTFFPPSPDIPPAYSHGGLPGDPEEIEIREILDRKGYKAKWLEKKLDNYDPLEWRDFSAELREECRKQRRNGEDLWP